MLRNAIIQLYFESNESNWHFKNHNADNNQNNQNSINIDTDNCSVMDNAQNDDNDNYYNNK